MQDTQRLRRPTTRLKSNKLRAIEYQRLGAPPPPPPGGGLPPEDEELLEDEEEDELELLDELEDELLDEELLEDELELLELEEELELLDDEEPTPASNAPRSITVPSGLRTSNPASARCGCICTGCAADTVCRSAGNVLPPAFTARELAERRKSSAERFMNGCVAEIIVPSFSTLYCEAWEPSRASTMVPDTKLFP